VQHPPGVGTDTDCQASFAFPDLRVIANYGGGGTACISFRWKGDCNSDNWIHVFYLPGTMVAIAKALLTNPEIEHRHTPSDRVNVSLIYGVAAKGDIAPATEQQIQDAQAAQPDVRFDEMFEFDMAEFQGKHGSGYFGSGSKTRNAVSVLSGMQAGGYGTKRPVPLSSAAATVYGDDENEPMDEAGLNALMAEFGQRQKVMKLLKGAGMQEIQTRRGIYNFLGLGLGLGRVPPQTEEPEGILLHGLEKPHPALWRLSDGHSRQTEGEKGIQYTREYFRLFLAMLLLGSHRIFIPTELSRLSCSTCRSPRSRWLRLVLP
jgi:hypothetical protein